MNRNGALAVFAVLASSACSDTGTFVSFPLPATAIVVDPAEFLGDVPCFPQFGDSSGGTTGAMRRYVATLVSVRTGGVLDAGDLALPSSPPTRCSERVSFQRVVNGTPYVAEIDGYDVDQIRPLGPGGISGSRVMVDDQNRFVAPRWRTSCGKAVSAPPKPTPPEPPDAAPNDAGDAASDTGPRDAASESLGPRDAAPESLDTGPRDAAPESLDTGVPPYGRCTGRALAPGEVPNLEGPVCAVANIAIPMHGCAPLLEVNPSKVKTTAITVDLADTLAAATLPDGGPCLSCVENGIGQIAQFRVELDGSSEPPKTASCGQPIPFELPPGKLATFTVTAYGSGASPSAGACKTGDGDSGTGPSDGSAAGPVNGAFDAGACGSERQVEKGNAGIWCTRCFGQPLPGISLRATCDPLAATQRRSY